ncbi:MAG: T9SS type A sorting domain-containing protein [Bacteroidia bacterium]|jgi:para-nitrobenzyl esterase
MKHFILFFSLLSFSLASQAQFDCSNGRYSSEVFSSVQVLSDITYGQATNVQGNNQSLELDLYLPQGDTSSNRPLLIMAHGGSFIGGNKTGTDVVPICQKFAKLGYVVASIEYRLGFGGFLPTEETATAAVFRATSDMKAAIRFFRKDAETSNLYKINPDFIFAGGVSAGAFMALHAAYLDQESEVPASINLSDFGGIEGNSGNPGYSSEIKAVVNLCGAIGDSSWIAAGDVPCLSMHGTNDGTVPYGSDIITVLFVPLLEVDGSASIHERMLNVGVPSTFISWPDADHVPFVSSLTYQQSVFESMVPFLYDQLGCSSAGLDVFASASDPIQLYPNPSNNNFSVVLPSSSSSTLEIFDLSGRPVYSQEVLNASSAVSTTALANGLYTVKLTSIEKTYWAKLVVKH